MLGAASVLVVHAGSWVLLVEVFHTLDNWREEERGVVALKP